MENGRVRGGGDPWASAARKGRAAVAVGAVAGALALAALLGVTAAAWVYAARWLFGMFGEVGLRGVLGGLAGIVLLLAVVRMAAPSGGPATDFLRLRRAELYERLLDALAPVESDDEEVDPDHLESLERRLALYGGREVVQRYSELRHGGGNLDAETVAPLGALLLAMRKDLGRTQLGLSSSALFSLVRIPSADGPEGVRR